MKTHCLILGATGFLGKNLCHTLLAQDYDITIYARTSYHLEEFRSFFPEVKIVLGNFETEDNFVNVLKNIDIVFHLVSGTLPSNTDMLREFSVNIIPTIRLLEACVKVNREVHFVYFSSGGTVYGIPQYLPIDEAHRTDPISTYGIHKLTVEKCIEYYGRCYGIRYTILRISNPYGAYQRPVSSQGVVAVFIAKILMGQPIEIWGDGSVVRDYIFVGDVMKAIASVMRYHGAHRIFNIGSGKGISLKELLQMMEEKAHRPALVKYIPGRIQDVSANILDYSLICRETGWSPQTDISQGIRYMLNFWDESRKCYIMGR